MEFIEEESELIPGYSSRKEVLIILLNKSTTVYSPRQINEPK